VLYEGQLYEAKWWTQGENPSESGHWDVWKKGSN
jgi:chitodextrinase